MNGSKYAYPFAFFLFVTISLSAWSEEKADLLLINGKIVTVDEAFSIASSMAIKGERILAVGDKRNVENYRGPQTEILDLKGKTVLPGLIDSHTHPADAAAAEYDHPIPDMETIQDVLHYIKERAASLKEGEWIFVSQIFLTRLKEQRYPTRKELDEAAPKNPVIFRTGPDASVNSLALQMSGIDENWKVDDGGAGFAEKDPQTGKLTGILRNSTRYLKYRSPEKTPNAQERGELLQKLLADYNRVGITGVGERDASSDEIALYKKLRDDNALTVRAFLSQHLETNQPIENIKKELRDLALSKLFQGDSLLRVCAAKTYLDGGMLTGSAFMRQPWGVSQIYGITDPKYAGLRFIEQEPLINIIDACMELDIQYMAHTVGDGAVHAFLDACEALREKYNIREKRPVICHSNFMSEEAVRKAAELGVCLDIQPAWLYLDGRTLLHHFGWERLTWFQPLRSIFAAGALAGGGSDHMKKIGSLRSINFYDPWLAIWTTMTRRAKWVDEPIHSEQALSRVEAIRFYTINNAYLHFAEKERGSLEPGKLADFIITNENPMTCPIDEIKDMTVLRTYLGGKLVYSHPGEVQ
ncbi:MAG: amidohydrolase [Candidatus Omnitrophota bacterium]